MSNESIDEFMTWLDTMIEELEGEDSEFFTHEKYTRIGMIRGLKMAEDKAKELGFITPKIKGQGL